MRFYKGFQTVEIIKDKRKHRSPEVAGHPLRFQPRQQVTGQVFIVAQIGRKIPIVPSVIAADGNLVLSGRGTGNTDGDRIGLTARAGEPNHFSPWVQLDEPFGQIDFLRAI